MESKFATAWLLSVMVAALGAVTAISAAFIEDGALSITMVAVGFAIIMIGILGVVFSTIIENIYEELVKAKKDVQKEVPK